MVNQLRYPEKITQKECENCSNWDNLENIKIDNWEEVATCNLKSNQRPSDIHISNFNFNIPKEVKITFINVELDYSREYLFDPISVDAPILKINDDLYKKADVEATPFQLTRIVKFNMEDHEITPEDINSEDFGISIIFPKNNSENEGNLNFDYIRVNIEYDIPHFILSTDEGKFDFPDENNPLEKAIGDEFKYTMYFRNSNGVSKEKQEVKIYVPEGIEVEKFYFNSSKLNDNAKDVEDEFDIENMIWYPSVRGLGISRMRIVFKCTSEGSKVISSYNRYAGHSAMFHVNVHPKEFKSELSEFEKAIEDDSWIAQMEDTQEFKSIVQDTVIKIDDVSMEFDIPQEKIDTIKEYFIKSVKRELKPKKHFNALSDVSFEIKRGERVGIIGFNGAGKSTLLKVLAGVLKPTTGSTVINGNIAPLLELGAGFDHNYSGRENIFLNGAILGYSKAFLESKYDEIVEFSELEEFIDIPIKNYSSGMVAKLGFAVATIVDPEILILDEILSVGDVRFQKKSGDKIRSMISSGITVLLVSHSTAKIKELCNRAIWLDKGKLVMDGDVDEVCEAYIEASKEASDDELKDLELV
ncbi:MAG: ABC transporter ATP-binding protein [Methanobrevibacter sp.]|nr:ABC transporter ATP-binding protein [Methanobrevibacter sp.]